MNIENILHLHEVYEFISQWDDDYLEMHRLLVDPRSYIMSTRDKKVYAIIERTSTQTAELHVYADRGAGLTVVRLIKQVREWLKDNTEIRFVFNRTRDIRIGNFTRTFGSKYIGTTERGVLIYRIEV